MHPRSPYSEYTDFAQLAKDCPSFAKYLTDTSNINFKDPDAVRELTKSLLKRDFGLSVELPEDRLCPTVPNRFNYILWIQDLLDSTGGGITDAFDPSRKVVGLDVGTGASCIYPLLACTSRESWSMIGTDIDAKSTQCARENVERNKEKLGNRIAIFESAPDEPFFLLEKFGVERLDFTMCNPPFYNSIDEMFASAKAKQLPPSSACTGTTIEMVHSGGEIAFITRIFRCSLTLSSPSTWFTSMLGKLSSISPLLELIKPHTQNYAVTEFKQGSTRRWGLAWCFGDRRPSQRAERYGGIHIKGIMPFPTEFDFEVSEEVGVVVAKLDAVLSGLELKRWVLGGEGRIVGNGEAGSNVWSRAARRKKGREMEMEIETQGEKEGGEVKLGFRVEAGETNGMCEVLVRWTRGSEQVLFESFCGMLKRRMQEGAKKNQEVPTRPGQPHSIVQ